MTKNILLVAIQLQSLPTSFPRFFVILVIHNIETISNFAFQFPTVTVCANVPAKRFAPLEKILNYVQYRCCGEAGDPECVKQMDAFSIDVNVVSFFASLVLLLTNPNL